MSLAATAWAWSTPARGTKQHVLLALADEHRKDSGVCQVSTAELVEKTGLGERTVRRTVGELLADGLVEIANAGESGRALGGRRNRARYVFVVCVDTRPERPPFAGAKVVVAGTDTRPERPPFEPETRSERPGIDAETRPNLHANPAAVAAFEARNPATVAPLSLRDIPGEEQPGTTPCTAIAVPSQDDDGLFDEPDRPTTPETINAGHAVAAWTDAYTETHRGKPTGRAIGQVGRECRQLLEAGNRGDLVVAAARQAGARGFATVEREFHTLTRTAGAHPAHPAGAAEQHVGTGTKRAQAFLNLTRRTPA